MCTPNNADMITPLIIGQYYSEYALFYTFEVVG